MTERVQPGAKGSRYRGIEIGEAISGGSNYIIDPDTPTLSSIRYGTLDQDAYDGFSETHSDTSFDVTIGPGEAFVDGWLAKDTPTTVTLQSDTENQAVVLGWNPDAVYDEAVDDARDDADEVLLDTEANIDAMTQEKPVIPIWEFDTDTEGVTAARRITAIGSDKPATTRLPDGTIEYEADDGTVSFAVKPDGTLNVPVFDSDSATVTNEPTDADDVARKSEVDSKADDPHGNDAHSPDFSELDHDHTDTGESSVPVSGIDLPSLVVEKPEHLPIAELNDDESIEFPVVVQDGETLEVYRWGAYDVGTDSAPTGLTAELLDGGDTVQQSENTIDTSGATAVASHQNTSGSVSVFKLRAFNGTGSVIDSPGVGAHFGYRVV